MWKEADMAYFEVLAWNSYEGTEETQTLSGVRKNIYLELCHQYSLNNVFGTYIQNLKF
jgi:hypothetical protein